ncbi:trifunctional dihydropteroate synthetase [Scheffersomyces spartinae]|uniref:Folic acid synthesis protein fol1 n=1 Tax=Scheffersomyces spartinae TaxID=45513 RepID=A0A9P8AG50_9ASCO|nr:trifunctional dihydropteroate synthetase [Scheffersomyces spartinae]KAG7191843.1 trifunctional dihydropteroate synthetase [Scheffersomyces spartinae]
MLQDSVFIKKLAATTNIGKDAWNRPTPQPINVSVELRTDFRKASKSDNLKYSLNYAVISRNILEFLKAHEHKNFKSLGNIAEAVSAVVLDEKRGGGLNVKVLVQSTKSEIRADSVKYIASRSNDNEIVENDEIEVNGLKLLTIIGVFTFERLQRQIVDIDLNLQLEGSTSTSTPISEIIENVVSYVELSNFKTVEALVFKIGQLIFQFYGEKMSTINIKVTKPNAISYTEGVGVSSTMTSETFKDSTPIEFTTEGQNQTQLHGCSMFNLPTDTSPIDISKDHTAYIAFGSNKGNQVDNINKAILLLESFGVKVLATSTLYISKPMYYLNQPDFLNGVLKVQFLNKSPHDLLSIIKDIEYNHINRVKEFDNGPRSIDLDILLYDDITMNEPDLCIPHKSMLERSFVLQPLCELVPHDLLHPISAEPLHNHLRQVFLNQPSQSLQESNRLLQYVHLPNYTTDENPLKFDHLHNQHPTVVMGVLNITPDSFSDGGDHYNKPIEDILEAAENMIQDGATVLDIGGVSTKPGSEPPSTEEELARILPVIKAIRSSSSKSEKLSKVIISVDTYRAKVAEECLLAGANIINDISMGMYDDQMFSVVAKYGCPYVMNHTRGSPKSMLSLTTYESNTNDDIVEFCIDPVKGDMELSYPPDVSNLLTGIGRELSLQMLKAFEAGVRKWQIIVDPGIGFAKNLEQNVLIIRHASHFKKYSVMVRHQDEHLWKLTQSYLSFNGLPMLLGPSRKKFLGTLVKEPAASRRAIPTAAAIVACVEQRSDIVRVHDVHTVKQAISIADAIYRDVYSQ